MKKYLFLIDDDEAIQFIVKSFVEKSDFFNNYESAKNGFEALEKLKDLPELPTTFLVDINMPVMNGFEFIDEFMLSENFNINNHTIAMISSSDNPQDIERMRSLKSIDLFLKKPFRKDYLIQLNNLTELKLKKGA